MTAPSKRYDLTGRTALVTGAGGLLGRQHTAALVDAGARVVVTDIGPPQCEAAIAAVKQIAPAADLVPVTIDVTSQELVQAAAFDLTSRGISIDILVNNAAIDPKVTSTPGVMHSSRFEAFPVPQWQMEIAVGLTGAMLCSQVFGGAMAKRGRGVILNIASDLGVIAPDQRLYRQPNITRDEEQPVKPVTYSVIKHGLIGLTKYLATYWADRRRARQRDLAGRRFQQPGSGLRRKTDAPDPDGPHGAGRRILRRDPVPLFGRIELHDRAEHGDRWRPKRVVNLTGSRGIFK